MDSSVERDLFQVKNEDSLNLKEVLGKYLVHWPWFVVSLLFFLSLAYIYLKTQTPIYSIHSTILLKDEKNGTGGQDLMLKSMNIFASSKIVDNEIAILKSYSLVEKVAKELKLNITYYIKLRSRFVEIYKECPLNLELIRETPLTYDDKIKIDISDGKSIEINGTRYAITDTIPTPYGTFKISLKNDNYKGREIYVSIKPVSSATFDLINRLTIAPISKMSTVLELTLEDAVPQKGMDILNNLMNDYNLASLEDKNIEASKTLAFIDGRLKLLKGDLGNVENNVEEFESKEGVVDLSEDAKNFLDAVKDNDMQIFQVKLQLTVLDSLQQYVNERNPKQGIVPATLLGLGLTNNLSDPTLIYLINGLTALEQQRETNVRLIKEENPLRLSIDEQIRKLKNDIRDNVGSLKQNLTFSVKQLESQNAQLEETIKNLPHKERTLVDISREQTTYNNLFNYLLQTREETEISLASAVSDSRIIDTAISSLFPVRPVHKIVYLVFIIIGLFIPFLIIYLRDLFNDTVKNKKELTKETNIPIVGELSWTKHDKAIIMEAESRSVFAEQMRVLRTNLSYLTTGKDVQNILFTSSISGEGKSFISLNLAVSFAITGKKVIILEFDLRKPKLMRSLNLQENKGLSEYLIAKAEIDEIVLPVPGYENFYIISSGKTPPNPVELILNGRIDGLITELRKRFDYVIIDAPPIGIVTDAQLLEKQTDVTLFVVRHKFTPVANLHAVNKLYEDKRFKKLSIVFNGIRSEGRYGYGYGYGYKYEYGYYGGKDKRKGWFKKLFHN